MEIDTQTMVAIRSDAGFKIYRLFPTELPHHPACLTTLLQIILQRGRVAAVLEEPE